MPSSRIEPGGAQTRALLPPHARPTLVPRLGFGDASWRIADAARSATTRRRRRDEGIALGRVLGVARGARAIAGGLPQAPLGEPRREALGVPEVAMPVHRDRGDRRPCRRP